MKIAYLVSYIIFILSALSCFGSALEMQVKVDVEDRMESSIKSDEGYLALDYTVFIKNISRDVVRVPTNGFKRMVHADRTSIRSREALNKA